MLLQIHLDLLSTAIVKNIYFLTISARVDNDSGFISRGKSLITNIHYILNPIDELKLKFTVLPILFP